MILITIIIPVYKIKEADFRTCIESVRNQTLDAIEIILVDDGSPDDCPHICDDYAKKDRRIQVIHQKNQGVSAARNRGLQAASGQFVTFVDADDWCEPELCEKVFEYATKNNSDILIFSAIQEARWTKCYHIWPSNIPLFTKAQKERLIEICILPRNFNDGIIISTWSKVYKREFILQNSILYNPKILLGEDNLFNLECLLKATNISYLNKCFYHYRQQNENQTTNRYHPKFHKDTDSLINHLSQILYKNKINEKYELLLSTRAIALVLEYVLPQEFLHPDNPKPLKQILKEISLFLQSPHSNIFCKSYLPQYFSLSKKIGIILCRHQIIWSFRLIWLKWIIQKKAGMWRY